MRGDHVSDIRLLELQEVCVLSNLIFSKIVCVRPIKDQKTRVAYAVFRLKRLEAEMRLLSKICPSILSISPATSDDFSQNTKA
jgi:hypothetical protein